MQANGVDIKGAVWFETGAATLNGGKLNYFGNEIPLTLQGVIVINTNLVFLAEWFRFQEAAPGYVPDCEDTLTPATLSTPSASPTNLMSSRYAAEVCICVLGVAIFPSVQMFKDFASVKFNGLFVLPSRPRPVVLPFMLPVSRIPWDRILVLL